MKQTKSNKTDLGMALHVWASFMLVSRIPKEVVAIQWLLEFGAVVFIDLGTWCNLQLEHRPIVEQAFTRSQVGQSLKKGETY